MLFPGYHDPCELARTPGHVWFRARRAGAAESLLIKAAVSSPPRAADDQQLDREYELLRSLSIPGIVRPRARVLDGGASFLVLEDQGLMPLTSPLRVARIEIAGILELGIALCNALIELHRREFVLNGMPPSTIFVSEDFATVQLVDLSLARRLPIDPRGLVSDLLLAGAARSMAPEQTGRVNRAIDHRADLYVLGVTLYELLAGRPPFEARDPLELIHRQIAKAPPPMAAGVPEQLARVVLRLLAKAAEDRYQSASGARHDLERCRREWNATRSICEFALGTRDVSDRFLVPQRLYGRDYELRELSSAFEAAQTGRAGLLLVSGYSGVGKTSFIHELCRPIARQRGYFAAGKFDQVARHVPYSALIQAFRGLFWLILAESEERLVRWRTSLAAALGTNAGVIAEVIPELEFILGKQPAAPQLEAAEAQNRFRYVFENFVATFAQPNQPLAIFLDDLQWADSATLDLLHLLLTASEPRNLLIIGAYRDNDVEPGHPLMQALGRIEREGASVRRVALGSLELPDLTSFVADSLRTARDDVAELAQLIQTKTDGNPFFVIQFLRALVQDGLIRFDYESSCWLHRIDEIAAAGITDNVVDLMMRRIQRLSERAQSVLRLAACIGSPFKHRSLRIASGFRAHDLDAGLAEALDAGLVEPAAVPQEVADAGASASLAYAFIHDRVQQAAYALIPPDQRQAVHLDVGRLLLAECGADVPEDRLFEIAGQLNLGKPGIAPHERLAIARLNQLAGRKAKASAAYEAASGYLHAAVSLLDAQTFDSDYALAFSIHWDAAESQYLAGHFDEAQQSFSNLLARARSSLDRASVYGLMILANENMARYGDAVRSGRSGLALFGIALPDDVGELQLGIDREIDRIREVLAGRSIRELVDLPVMADADMRMVMRILTAIWAPAYISGNDLQARFISATMVRLSLTHGNTEDSAYGYVTHAVTVGPVKRDFQAAHDWGELALRVNERFDDAKRRAKIHQQLHAHVKLWCRPFATCVPHAREARRSGLETGDFAYAGYGAATESWPGFLINTDLERFVREHQPNLELLERIRMGSFRDVLRLMLNWARALQGRTRDRLSLSDAHFEEDEYVARYREAAPLLQTFLFTARLQLAVLMEDVPRGVAAARAARQVTVTGTIWPVLSEFWGGLALAAAYGGGSEAERIEWLSTLRRAEQNLGELAQSCPENYKCFHLLLAAELARIEQRNDAALALSAEALNYAQLTDNLQLQALAAELCARTWQARGNHALARGLCVEAYRCYATWGATVKLRQLEEKYGLTPAGAVAPARESVSPESGKAASFLDVGSVVKVAQVIAGEIELEALLSKFIQIALENAGAERGMFVYESDEGQGRSIAAQLELAHGAPAVRGLAAGALEGGDSLDPLEQSVIRYVRRTGQDVIAGDAASDERFAAEAARSAGAARSVLCTPVSHQGRVGGILYLASRMTEAFTADRIEIVRVLAGQAAISLENARLYAAMRGEVERRNHAERELREALGQLELLKNRLQAENAYLQEEIVTQHNFNEIIGHSRPLVAALRKLELVAPTDSTVLIVGETGSGKELIARAVHSRSQRRDRALVKVNCGAIAPGLVESELFGHVKGAFTGAVEKRIGRFELANGGTLFLDEVGELPPEAQVKLLRVLQEQEFEPVGSSRTLQVDVRVIAATNRNLERAVHEGRFRADLLYRLNVFPVDVPPLRERAGDIPLLAASFVTALARKLGKPLSGFSAKSLDLLSRYPWPGNVRELQNVVERAAILATGPVLEVDPALLEASTRGHEVPASGQDGASMDDVQRAHIQSVLRSTGGVIDGNRGAAVVLGMHPNTLRSRMKKLGIASRGARS